MKDMIFWGVIAICNLILARNVDGSLSIMNLIAYFLSGIYFVYLYIKERKNEKGN